MTESEITFGQHVAQIIESFYGNIDIPKEETDKLNEAIEFDDEKVRLLYRHDVIINKNKVYDALREEYIKQQALNSLFKTVSKKLLKGLNVAELKYGTFLRKNKTPSVNKENVKLNINLKNDTFDEIMNTTLILYNENKTIGENNIRMLKLIDELKAKGADAKGKT